ncbi:tetratricopeptide repeat protein [Thiohalorhabdus sp.]|uniref:tetratricopeptide repeat protein n=1 Tax=Thiohalorhabdus sp. TaxID=3094134 RepID=UPI002FC28CAD
MIHVEKALAKGREALDEGRLDEAEAELRGILEFDDYEPRALRLMGKVASLRGQPQRAAEFLEKALEAPDPDRRDTSQGPPPTPTLAELYAGQGHTEAAAAVYRQLLAEASEDERSGEWRRRLAALDQGEGEAALMAEAATERPPAAGASASAASGAGLAGLGIDPRLAERRLTDFLDRLDGNYEALRLRRFLDRLEERTSQ